MKKFLCLHFTAFLLFFVSCQEENLNPVSPETATEIGLSRSDAELLSLTKDSKQKGNTAEETVLNLLPNYSDR